MRFFILSFLLILFAFPVLAAEAELSGYDFKLRGEGVVLRLKTNQMVDFKTFELDNPKRLVVDIADAKWTSTEAEKPEENIWFIQRVRTGRPEPKTVRVVLDLNKPAKVEDAFMQIPSRNGEPYYLLVQMQPAPEEKKLDIPSNLKRDFSKPSEKTITVEKKVPTTTSAKKEEAVKVVAPEVSVTPAATPAETVSFVPAPKPKPEFFTIVIDAGHGGVDPGAIGALGTKEKVITLRYAKHLKEILEASGRYRVVMTRNGDTYLPLRKRLEKAQAAQGHLFISLHADSHPDPNTRGLSVYTLSENASDEEAAALARRENKSDIITGVDLSGQSKDVTQVLIDLAQRETNNTSAQFAELVVVELGTEAKLLRNTHRFAGFAVLKGVSVPSALIELGYLSNPEEEKQLIRKEYQDKLVNAIVRAIDIYCDQYAKK